jgi:hypothetical protein
MTLARSALILLACLALGFTAATAGAVTSRLSPNPPPGFRPTTTSTTQRTTTASPTTTSRETTATTSASTTTTAMAPSASSKGLPRTGDDLRSMLIIAAALVAAGALLRLGCGVRG